MRDVPPVLGPGHVVEPLRQLRKGARHLVASHRPAVPRRNPRRSKRRQTPDRAAGGIPVGREVRGRSVQLGTLHRHREKRLLLRGAERVADDERAIRVAKQTLTITIRKPTTFAATSSSGVISLAGTSILSMAIP
jgi:hypothetical protein